MALLVLLALRLLHTRPGCRPAQPEVLATSFSCEGLVMLASSTLPCQDTLAATLVTRQNFRIIQHRKHGIAASCISTFIGIAASMQHIINPPSLP